MKKLFAFSLSLILGINLFACSSTATTTATTQAQTTVEQTTAAPVKTDVIVFAAASMKETMETIKAQYEKTHNVNIIYNFDSSGTLKTQIQTGADCDIFISAAPKQMNQLDIEADPSINTEGLDYIDHSTRLNLLENKVALCVSDSGKDKNINSYDDLAKALEQGNILFCMGNSDVPVGQYTQKILAYYNLDESALSSKGIITYGSNVKEVTTQVKENTCDAGVIYATDAFSAGLTVTDTATKEMCGQVIYPAAVLKNAPNKSEAQNFLNYLTSDFAKSTFEAVGFSMMQ